MSTPVADGALRIISSDNKTFAEAILEKDALNDLEVVGRVVYKSGSVL